MNWIRVICVKGMEVLTADGVAMVVELPRLADYGGIRGVVQRLAPAIKLGPSVQTVNGMFARGSAGNQYWLAGVAIAGAASAGYVVCATHEVSISEAERFVIDKYLGSAADALAYLAD